jgi:hypothetical protein
MRKHARKRRRTQRLLDLSLRLKIQSGFIINFENAPAEMPPSLSSGECISGLIMLSPGAAEKTSSPALQKVTLAQAFAE